MMAQAARDPLFLAALTVAEQDAPGVGTFCIRCHSPQGFVKGNATPGLGTALDDDDKQGVACDACHRSVDPSKTDPVRDAHGPYAGNGQLFWEEGAVKRGPYADADSPAHTTLQDAFTSSANLCGQCHELSNPAVTMLDGNGQDTGLPFPLDTTFTEWASSVYGKGGAGSRTCVECHMAPSKGSLTVSTFPSAATRENPRTHLFAAANVWGIDAVQAAEPSLATSRRLEFKAARAAALATLGQAVKVEITHAPDTLTPGAPVALTVRVTNLTGHKFPTGYADGRRAFLRLELVDAASGNALSTIGAYDDATQTLVQDPQLHIYEAVHEEHTTGNPPLEWHIARSNTIAHDTRIPPKGFTSGPTTPIVGADYGDGQGGIRDYDEATFSIPWPAGHSPAGGSTITVRATVLYQSTVREFVDALAAANHTDDRGEKLRTVWNATGKGAPLAIASAEKGWTLPGGAGGGGETAGDDGSGCGCGEAVGVAPGGAGAAVLLVGLGAIFGRRRRRAGRE
jgi:hypothetical protein